MTASTRATPALGTLWLVRHAPTSWTGVRWCGRADPPLTTAGRTDAETLADGLTAELPSGAVLLSSPAQRTRATADAIARRLAITPIVLDELVEVDVGRAEGLTWGELSDREPALAAAIASGAPVDWPGGESTTQVADRARSAAARIAEIGRGQPTVVVSHGAFLHALARAIAGDAAASWVPLAPCGVVRIERPS